MLVLAALMVATTLFPTSAYASVVNIPLDDEDYMILDADDILGVVEY
jgi:co-chaperonin GroES (HSP10)